MSKIVMSLPKGMVKNAVIGGILALAAYVALQLGTALLIHKEVLGETAMYPAVCVSAALAAFLGCGYSIWKGRGASMLTTTAVVVVFLTLTLAAALLTTDTVAIENGLTGVGLSMAAGGLAAALLGGSLPLRGERGGRRSRKKRSRRT